MIELILGVAAFISIIIIYISVYRFKNRINKVYPLLGVVHPQNREKEDN